MNANVSTSLWNSAEERERIRTFFVRVTADTETHARFVNTLSFLEYVGARKILKSQSQEGMTAELLAHVAEEIRHAQLFKRMALALSEGKLEDYSPDHLWEAKKSWRYFQGLDQACARLIVGMTGQPDPVLNYHLTTFGIENRALVAYREYLGFVANDSHRKLLAGIIKEEEVHLRDTDFALRASLRRPEILDELARIESDLFWTWIA